MPDLYFTVMRSSISLALLPEPPGITFCGINVHFLGVVGGLREASEIFESVASGFVGVASGIFDGIASGSIGITGGLDRVIGRSVREVGQVSGESGSPALGLEPLGFSCSDSRLMPAG